MRDRLTVFIELGTSMLEVHCDDLSGELIWHAALAYSSDADASAFVEVG